MTTYSPRADVSPRLPWLPMCRELFGVNARGAAVGLLPRQGRVRSAHHGITTSVITTGLCSV